MNSNDMRETLEKLYNLDVLDVTPAPRGFYAQTYRVTTNEATYFLKMLDAIKFSLLSGNFETSLPAVEHLYSMLILVSEERLRYKISRRHTSIGPG